MSPPNSSAGQQITIPVLLTGGFNSAAMSSKTNANLTARLSRHKLVIGEFTAMAALGGHIGSLRGINGRARNACVSFI